MKAGAFLPWVQVLRAVTDLPNSTRHSVFHLSGTWAVPCPLLEVKPLLVGLGSLGTALGTRPRRCTPISVSLVVVQTRPDIRVRVRRIVIRIRVRHTAIRIRVVVAAIDHTAYGSFHPEKCILSAFRLQRYSFSARLPKIPPTSTGLRPYFLMSSCLRHHALRFVASLPFSLFRLRYLDCRLVRGHALRHHDFAAEGQTRPDIRVRVRRIGTRIRERHTAIRIRVVVAAIDHTACRCG